MNQIVGVGHACMWEWNGQMEIRILQVHVCQQPDQDFCAMGDFASAPITKSLQVNIMAIRKVTR